MNEKGEAISKNIVIQLNDKITTIPAIKNYLLHLSASLSPEDRKALSVSIKADSRADMGTILDIKQMLREANVLNVNFSATMSHSIKH